MFFLRIHTEHASDLSIDAKRIGIFGVDAGANLALSLNLMRRDHKQPPLSLQILCSGIFDTRESYDSWTKFRNKYVALAADTVKILWKIYLNPGDEKNPYACPLLVEDFTGLPRTIVWNAEFDPVASHSEVLAERLTKANRKNILRTFYAC